MMLSNSESGYPVFDKNDSSNGEFLRDIEEISKALYVDNKTHQNSLVSSSNSRAKSVPKSRFSDLKSKSKSKPGFDDDDDDELLRDERKSSSIWGWKPFKALSHIRQRKFATCFFCHVHCIENLPSDWDDVSVRVHLKRKDSVLKTVPSRVSNGMAEFEETLMSKCHVYFVKNGPGKFVKYEPKHFLLCASIVEAGGIDVGKHWVDLTRLLPLTIEELEEDKCSGKWSTSFKLAGKAKGATLHVSFAFLVTKDDLAELDSNMNLPLALNLERNRLNRRSFVADEEPRNGNASLRRVGSVPSSWTTASSNSSQSLDVQFSFPKDLSDFSNSINMLYGKLEEKAIDSPVKFDVVFEHLESLKLAPNSFSGSGKDFNRAEHNEPEFTVIEKGVELERSEEEEIKMDVVAVEELDVSPVEVIDVVEIFKGEGISSDEERQSNGKGEVSGCAANDALVDKHTVLHRNELNDEKEVLDLHEMFFPEYLELECSVDDIPNANKVNQKGCKKMVRSLSLDDVTKAVADDFFNLLQETQTPASTLSSNGSLESPRERLLREFEEDMMMTSCSFFLDDDVQEDEVETDYTAPSLSFPDYNVEGLNLLPVIDTTGQKSAKHSSKSKKKAELLERLETQSLMERWGLDEEAFKASPHYSTGGFGSPIYVPPDEPVGLPPLGEGLEPLLELKNGGLLRSMSPSLFRNVKNCGSLVLQASKSVVLPAELGSDIMEILQCLASVGVERLSQKAHKIMPLEELSGKIMQQLAWEASSEAEVLNRPAPSKHESHVKIEAEGFSHVPCCNNPNSSPTISDMGPEYVLLKDLASLALGSVEVLMIEGLRIQSGMSDHDAPSSIKAKSVGEVASQNRIVYFDESSDLMAAKGTANYVEGLFDLSISLDDWLRLDAGTFGDNDLVDDHTLKLLTAHHAKYSYISDRRLAIADNTPYRSVKFGILGDSLTVALTTQLRDPLRNYEPVGAPMLCLIQVKRESRPPVSELDYSSSSEKVDKKMDEVEDGQEAIPRFRVNEVHVVGLKTESGNPEIWASRRQQQSGSRWLLASGLTKNCKSQFTNSKSITTLSTRVLRNTWTQNLMWSISCHTNGVEADPSQLSTLRNPDIIFPEEAV